MRKRPYIIIFAGKKTRVWIDPLNIFASPGGEDVRDLTEVCPLCVTEFKKKVLDRVVFNPVKELKEIEEAKKEVKEVKKEVKVEKKFKKKWQKKGRK